MAGRVRWAAMPSTLGSLPPDLRKVAYISYPEGTLPPADLFPVETSWYWPGGTPPPGLKPVAAIPYMQGDTIPPDLYKIAAFPGDDTASPLQIAGCVLWVAADTSPTTIVTGVSQINDLSGNGNNLVQATGSKQPTVVTGANGIGGLPALSFDGVDDFLTAATATSLNFGTGPFTVVAVFSTLSTINYSEFIGKFKADYTGKLWLIELGTPGAGLLNFDTTPDGYTTSTTYKSTSTVNSGTPRILIASDDRVAAPKIFLDGVNVAVDNGGTALVSTGFDLSNTEALSIGADNLGGSAGAYKFAEIVIFNRSLSATERGQLTAYLGRKYGITVV